MLVAPNGLAVNNVRRSSSCGGSDQLLVKTRGLEECKKNS